MGECLVPQDTCLGRDKAGLGPRAQWLSYLVSEARALWGTPLAFKYGLTESLPALSSEHILPLERTEASGLLCMWPVALWAVYGF